MRWRRAPARRCSWASACTRAARYRVEFVEFGPPRRAASRGARCNPPSTATWPMLEHYARRYEELVQLSSVLGPARRRRPMRASRPRRRRAKAPGVVAMDRPRGAAADDSVLDIADPSRTTRRGRRSAASPRRRSRSRGRASVRRRTNGSTDRHRRAARRAAADGCCATLVPTRAKAGPGLRHRVPATRSRSARRAVVTYRTATAQHEPARGRGPASSRSGAVQTRPARSSAPACTTAPAFRWRALLSATGTACFWISCGGPASRSPTRSREFAYNSRPRDRDIALDDCAGCQRLHVRGASVHQSPPRTAAT
jgi:hypothetical protein